MNLFIIDWSKTESTPLVDCCTNSSHKVIGYELTDGGEAYKKTARLLPDAIVINYAVKPSHGRRTAEQIHKRKSTSHIPIYFINGDEDDNELAEHLGICFSEEEFKELLET